MLLPDRAGKSPHIDRETSGISGQMEEGKWNQTFYLLPRSAPFPLYVIVYFSFVCVLYVCSCVHAINDNGMVNTNSDCLLFFCCQVHPAPATSRSN